MALHSSRCRFIRHGLVISLLTVFSASAHAASHSYTIYIRAGNLTVEGSGGATIPAWGYTDLANGTPKIPGPVVEAREGDSVTVTVFNDHDLDHNFVVQGLTTDTAAIAYGKSRQYTFSTPKAGVYFYRDTLNNNINREMGLYGAVVVRTADGSNRAWTDGPAFNSERLWVVSEMDKPRWNDVAAAGGKVDTDVYRPNYFLINGMGGFKAMKDENTYLDGLVGDTALVRIVNAGQFSHSLHLHGTHVQVLDVNGTRLSAFEWMDTVDLKPGSTMMIMHHFAQKGEYPMHVHTAQMETANGVYLNGVATMWMAK